MKFVCSCDDTSNTLGVLLRLLVVALGLMVDEMSLIGDEFNSRYSFKSKLGTLETVR